MNKDETIKMCEKFHNKRIGAKYTGIWEDEVLIDSEWYATVGGCLVGMDGKRSSHDRKEALDIARRFKQKCINYLKELGAKDE